MVSLKLHYCIPKNYEYFLFPALDKNTTEKYCLIIDEILLNIT